MTWIKIASIILTVSLGCVVAAHAQESDSPSRLSLQRDSVYEQYLHFQASPDTAITPARVLRWMNSMLGHTNVGAPASLEFQPVLHVRDHQEQIIAQIAYKF